jgi:hypothetical protein
MEWYEIVLLVLAILLVFAITLLGIQILRYKTINENIEKVIKKHYPNIEITKYKAQMIYQLEFETEKRYIIKLIDMKPQSEVIITNSERVVVNDDIKGWKRSTKPNFVAGIKEFIKIESKSELVKIVLIYPNCHNITKYINESDVFLVKKFQKVNDIYYLRFRDLAEFLEKH